MTPDHRIMSIEDRSVRQLNFAEMHHVLKYCPVPFKLGVERKDKACWETCGKRCTRKKSHEQQDCFSFLLQKLTSICIMAVRIASQFFSCIDLVTDCILLRSAAEGEYIMFQMSLFFCLLAPYILCYRFILSNPTTSAKEHDFVHSAGVQIFLSRKTFSNVSILNPRFWMMLFYLFPTGILFFMLMDIVNVMMGLSKLICFGCLEKVESEEAWIVIESQIVESFGLSRTDWMALKQR